MRGVLKDTEQEAKLLAAAIDVAYAPNGVEMCQRLRGGVVVEEWVRPVRVPATIPTEVEVDGEPEVKWLVPYPPHLAVACEAHASAQPNREERVLVATRGEVFPVRTTDELGLRVRTSSDKEEPEVQGGVIDGRDQDQPLKLQTVPGDVVLVRVPEAVEVVELDPAPTEDGDDEDERESRTRLLLRR